MPQVTGSRNRSFDIPCFLGFRVRVRNNVHKSPFTKTSATVISYISRWQIMHALQISKLDRGICQAWLSSCRRYPYCVLNGRATEHPRSCLVLIHAHAMIVGTSLDDPTQPLHLSKLTNICCVSEPWTPQLILSTLLAFRIETCCCKLHMTYQECQMVSRWSEVLAFPLRGDQYNNSYLFDKLTQTNNQWIHHLHMNAAMYVYTNIKGTSDENSRHIVWKYTIVLHWYKQRWRILTYTSGAHAVLWTECISVGSYSMTSSDNPI